MFQILCSTSGKFHVSNLGTFSMPIPQVLSWSEDLEYHVVSATASEIREKIPGAGRITVSMDAFARENPIVPPATRRYFADKFVT